MKNKFKLHAKIVFLAPIEEESPEQKRVFFCGFL